MSNLVSALNMASDNSGIVRIEEAGLQGMITLRGDLSGEVLQSAATEATGVAMPAQNMANHAGDSGLCWMSPDELLVLCPYAEVGQVLAKMQETLGQTHALAVNVSDARACFRVSGDYAREVMAKLAPVDFSPEAFKQGMFRRSRMAQIAAAFWMVDENTFEIICFRSNARYMFDLLKVAAQQGSEVDYF